MQPGFGNGTVPGGWPNGRRFGDDVLDIAVTALISDLRVSPPIIVGPAGDNVDKNDIAYNKVLPTSIRSSSAASSTGRGAAGRSSRSTRRPASSSGSSKRVEGFNVRGVNYWESADGKDRRLIFSASNLLQAIDARTGEPIPRSAGRRVDLREGLDRDPATVEQQSRTPGRVFENLIILGSATNQEYASAPGDIRAFDVRTGALVWTFHTVPRPGEFGYDTWPEDAWKTSAAPTTGASSRSTRSAASSTSRPAARNTTSTAATATAPTCSATA